MIPSHPLSISDSKPLLSPGPGGPEPGEIVPDLSGHPPRADSLQLLVRRNQIMKRCFDITVGSFVLFFSLPFIGMSLFLVWLVSPGLPLFCQSREGRGGARLRVWKIRTMYPDAEQRLGEYLSNNPEDRAQWERNCKIRDDPRVLPVIGTFLRRFSIDELPQLWLVLRGQLSLVGPRPLPEYHLRKLEPELRRLRQQVRPGITGLWQIMARSEGGIDAYEMYDGYYLRNWYFFLDVHIIGKTVMSVIRGDGAY